MVALVGAKATGAQGLHFDRRTKMSEVEQTKKWDWWQPWAIDEGQLDPAEIRELGLYRILSDRGVMSAARVLRRRGILDEENLRRELSNTLLPEGATLLQSASWAELQQVLSDLFVLEAQERQTT